MVINPWLILEIMSITFENKSTYRFLRLFDAKQLRQLNKRIIIAVIGFCFLRLGFITVQL